MPEDVKKVAKEAPKEEEKKRGLLGKVGDAIIPDHDEQLAIVSTFVRLGILVWSGGILTLNYVTIPKLPQQKIDPTFIASVFTGVLATFGVQTAKKSNDGTMKMNGNGNGNGANGGITKKEMEALLAKVSSGPVQTIRVEQAPIKITTDDKSEPFKM
jgi:hypothetical protein|tara:strand:- start:295 stop:765 length:471 start_codon:yes stop_codon:yes gene_type:complete